MGAGVGGIGGGFGAFGANIPIRPGSLNSNMAMQSYCRQYPRDCSDVMALVTGRYMDRKIMCGDFENIFCFEMLHFTLFNF